MNDIKDIKVINDINAVITYLKLVYIEQITKDKSYDTFKMLGGINLFDSLIKKVDEDIINLNNTNYELLNKFHLILNNISHNHISLSNITSDELKHLEWLEELKLNPNDLLVDTICKNSSSVVYENIIKNYLSESKCIYSNESILIKYKDILKESKKIK